MYFLMLVADDDLFYKKELFCQSFRAMQVNHAFPHACG
jgi:hypothetical protein